MRLPSDSMKREARLTFRFHDEQRRAREAHRMASISIPVPTRLAPLVPGLPIVGNLLNVWRDPLDHLMEVSTYGEVASVRFGPQLAFLLNDPDAIHHVLVDNNRNYTKSPNYGGLKLILGEGLVTS